MHYIDFNLNNPRQWGDVDWWNSLQWVCLFDSLTSTLSLVLGGCVTAGAGVTGQWTVLTHSTVR